MLDNASLFPGKHFISTVLEALETKTAMSSALVRQYLMRAAMAGVIIGLMYGVNFAVIAAFEEAGDGLYLVGKIVGALFFGWALVFIYYSKSELLTSNMMIVSIGLYHRRTTVGKALRILGLCYVGNIVGGLLVAVLFRYSSLTSGATGELMTDAVDHKLGYLTEGVTGWTDLLIRAVLCNFMINIAMLLVYNGIIKDDLTRCLVMVISVFVFAFLGLEHSVANTVLFFVGGLQDGIDVGLAAGNLGIALLGNLLGGGLLIGLYYAYVNDDSRFVARTTPGA